MVKPVEPGEAPAGSDTFRLSFNDGTRQGRAPAYAAIPAIEKHGGFRSPAERNGVKCVRDPAPFRLVAGPCHMRRARSELTTVAPSIQQRAVFGVLIAG